MRRILFLALMAISAAAFAQAPPGLIINGQGTGTLTWTAPTEYVNGDPLPASDLSGFVVFYHDQSRFDGAGGLRPGCTGSPETSRTDNSCYSNAVDLEDGSQVTQALTFQLSADTTLYFSMTSYVRGGNTFGDWSAYSSEVTKSFVIDVVDGRAPGEPVIQDLDMTVTCDTNLAQVTCTISVQ